MELNADFTQRVLVHSNTMAWVASPMVGVDRRMLDRIGDEVARATSIVRYAPDSAFSAHTHGGGEEFIVLEGVFEDEHGQYPEGTYVRNPPTTAHTPSSKQGCTILVKLWQFNAEDRNQFQKNMTEHLGKKINGIASAELHHDSFERVTYHALDAEAHFQCPNDGGIELFMLHGSGVEGDDNLEKGSWLRVPDGAPLSLHAGQNGAQFWLKTGHLKYAKAPELS